MNSLWSSKPTGEGNITGRDDAPPPPETNVADVGPEHEQAEQPAQSAQPPLATMSRPSLQRNSSAPIAPATESASEPAPLHVPVPPAPMPPPPPGPHQPTDSLSLVQLRRIVAEFNKPEPMAYDFDYCDFGTFEEEIDEWFSYQFWQWVRLNAAQAAFESQWEAHGGHSSWQEVDQSSRNEFVRTCLQKVQSESQTERLEVVRCLMYFTLGRWADTARPEPITSDQRTAASPSQLEAITGSVTCLTNLGGLAIVWQAVQDTFHYFWHMTPAGSQQDAHDELLNLMTIMYVSVQMALEDCKDAPTIRKALLALNPQLVTFLAYATSKLRWDENGNLPLTQMLLLLWKSVLLVFGGIKDIDDAKKVVSETDKDQKSNEVITASPLDYHVFRQELTSKYPAYVPPQPVIPLEADHSTLLPPPVNQPPKNLANGIVSAPPNGQSSGASILHQPVHIATPAPSPPPSPGVGGKTGKKQNYQTNQNFPFMYPPLDASSNSAGGKGGAGLQEVLVGRKWEGSEIPASILEAGELFSTRVRMSRATRQLWGEREKFLRSERGWNTDDEDGDVAALDLSVDLDPTDDLDLDLSELTLEEQELLTAIRGSKSAQKNGAPKQDVDEPEIDLGPHSSIDDPEIKRRLIAVEEFYRDTLQHLLSLVIVILRPIYLNVNAAQMQPNQQQPNAAGRGANPGVNGGPGPGRQQQQDPLSANNPEPVELSPEEVDATRSREIMTKAATGTILLLLKWFKISHVLKFEYMTQLLLDNSYIPLVLKLFAHQDIQQLVDSKTDRIENSFFYFCGLRSKLRDTSIAVFHSGPAEPTEAQEDSEDDAAPPPIKRRRSPTTAEPTKEEAAESDDSAEQTQTRPEVDELGYPVNPLPQEPITDFSRRNFFSLINYLRIMQKICKRKAHRNLLLVQFKSSNILRKSLKIPQPLLRLYNLKLFKNQVPYCGRKWRQSNMRVITAVYLHVRPELRDEWLAGSDVDAEVDSALPLEQALRSLTHWFNVRRYPDKIVGDLATAYRREQGFFTRELDRLGMTWQDGVVEDAANGDWAYEGGAWP